MHVDVMSACVYIQLNSTLSKWFETFLEVYVYMNAAELDPGAVARLISPGFPPDTSSTQKCLAFSASLYGKDIGALNVLDQDGNYLFRFVKGKNSEYACIFLNIIKS